jgi:dipeptidyl aminopeptidase/acylaminoacyl peptidase
MLLILFTFCAFGQNKVLDHTVYNDWKSLKNASISSNGKYISFQVDPHRGDGLLHWMSTKGDQKDSISRGQNAKFSHKENVLIFSIDPGYDTIRQLKLDEVKKEKMVKDTLGVFYLEQDSLVKIPNLIDFKLPQKGPFLAYRIEADSIKRKEVKEPKKRFRLFRKRKKHVEQPKKISSKGESLFILNLANNKQIELDHVVEYAFDESGRFLSFVQHKTIDKKDSFNIHLFDLYSFSYKTQSEYFTAIAQHNFSENGEIFAFVASQDTNKTKVNALYIWPTDEDQAQRIVHADRSDLKKALHVSEYYKPRFSKNAGRLFLGLTSLPEEEVEDSLLKSEKARLDIWHYKNKRLQPQQLKEKSREEKGSYFSVLHLAENKLVQLEDDTLNVRLIGNGNDDIALGTSNERYASTYNWSFPWPSDYYTVDLTTGDRKLVKSELAYFEEISPDGKYFVYFQSDSNNYYFQNTVTGEEDCMTCFEKDTITWKRDINGMPFKAGPIGVFGFSSPTKVIFHSKYDIWQYDFSGRRLTCLSEKKGKYMNTELRLRRWGYDSIYFDLDETYIIGTNQETMDESIYKYIPSVRGARLAYQYGSNHALLSIEKADNAEDVIFRQMNVTDYPDLYLTNVSFSSPEKISETNPQQDEYIWPTVEKVSWNSYDGKELDGLLYKPENFDSTKSYPMLVYFYELYFQRKHNHYIPKPTASIIYATEYTSAGYVVFIPDVRYEPGYPAKSAYDCILSGTDHVLSLYPNIDSSRMGLQGQSWGGYQTAQLVTMTDRYAAAMAGAPVSNMFSAYGGIRWGSGLNRAFQYERTQSRIGKTIWEAPELYIENSPLFGVPNIKTPLLIMHNDDDGAVPWYQGIEMFTAMKRLNKPVWMLNYNGDQHNLMQNANRVDLSIRMRQFFDYYLQGKPAPQWLIEGVPAIEKGESYGLEEYKEE